MVLTVVTPAGARRFANQAGDIAECRQQPVGPGGAVLNLPYAFTFVQRRILGDRLLPMVPVTVNAYSPPIQPTARRCFEFGEALGRALRAWDRAERIAVVAAGGMSHVAIDEELDRTVLDSIARRDNDDLLAIPEQWLQGGNSELKEWITAAGVLAGTALTFRELEYTTIVRSEAGTGQGMGYGIWSLPSPWSPSPTSATGSGTDLSTWRSGTGAHA